MFRGFLLITSSILSGLLLVACGGLDDGSVCDLASRHVASCTGRASSVGGGTCAGDEADLAGRLLGLSCEGVQSLADGFYGKADGEGCLAPWDCPDQYPSMDQPCGVIDMIKCRSYCEGFYTDPHMRLSSVSCEVLSNSTAHCQCKGYWLPWEKKQVDPTPEPAPEQPAPEDPPPFDPDDPDLWP